MRNVSDKFIEKSKQLLFNVCVFFFKSCRLWNNLE